MDCSLPLADPFFDQLVSFVHRRTAWNRSFRGQNRPKVAQNATFRTSLLRTRKKSRKIDFFCFSPNSLGMTPNESKNHCAHKGKNWSKKRRKKLAEIFDPLPALQGVCCGHCKNLGVHKRTLGCMWRILK